MKNIIGKGIESKKYYFNFSWGYFYFSAAYFFCKKIFNSFLMRRNNNLNTKLWRTVLQVY